MDLSAEGDRLTAAVTGGPLPASVRIDAGGVGIRCLVWGRDDLPTVVLVHGNGGHAHWWDPVVPSLWSGWRIVAPDLRGHGESDWPAEPAYRLDALGDDLTAVVDALAPGRFALVGHSMGGRIVLWWAAQAPARVRGLGLLDTRFDVVDAATAARFRGRVAGTRQGPGYPSYADAVAAFRFVPDEPAVPPAVRRALAHHAVRERAPRDWTFRFDRGVLGLEGDGGGDLHRLLPVVRCPTFVGSGAESWVMDEPARDRIVAGLAHPTSLVFPGAHHFLVAHGAAVGGALRAFLDGLA